MTAPSGTDPVENSGTDPAQGQPPAPTPTEPNTPPPAKAEPDWKAEARKWEQRAKENTAAAKKLAEIEEANKTEAQKQAERLAEAETAAAKAKAEALRFRVAAKHSISDEDADLFLTGTDEETLLKQAQRLMERTPAQPRSPQPNRQQGTPSNPKPGSVESGRERYLASKGGSNKT
jgi:hypothetical protein